MKKLFIALAVASFSLTSMAQEEPTLKHSVATNSFWSNWFIQVGGSWNSFYSNQEKAGPSNRNPFAKYRSSQGVSIAVGKWFTPGLGLRTKANGIWGRQVNSETSYPRFKYWTLNEHVMFNVSNMLFGYNPTRVWNVIPFLGGGLSRTMTSNMYAMQLSAGVQSTWRLSKRMNIYAEIGWDRLEGDFDGVEWSNGKRGWDTHDNRMYGELGLTFNLGKATWNKVPDVDAIKALSQSQIDALQAQLDDANAENARLKNLLANQKPVENKKVREYVSAPISVFFNINKTNIASQKDLINIQSMANYAKDNKARLLVTGYADSATGTPKINQKLSEGRANTVAEELVKMGVSRDQISTAAKGGVDDLSPVSFNRRATVQITE